MSLPKTFCPLPWMHLSANNAGQGRVCCDGYESLTERWDKAKGLTSYFNSEDYKKIRRQMMEGERPIHCIHCFNQEDYGVTSARVQHVGQYKEEEMKQLIEETAPDGTVKRPRISYLDIALGNNCNIKCRMCNPFVSYPIAKDWAKMKKDFSHDQVKEIFKSKWFASAQSFNLIKEALPTTKIIFFVGGEPMIVKEHLKILEMIVAEGHSNHICLRYNSNQTVIPPKIVKIWPLFKRVDFNCSVDAHGTLNDYIRYPTTWKKQEENLYLLDDISGGEGNIDIYIHSTFQAYSVAGIADFLDFLRNAKFKNIYRFPYFIWVKIPQWLMASIFPIQFKKKVATSILKKIDQHEDFFLNYNPNHREWTHQRISLLREMVKMMMDESSSSKHLQAFVKETTSHDKLRKQSILSVIPKMKPFFEKYP